MIKNLFLPKILKETGRNDDTNEEIDGESEITFDTNGFSNSLRKIAESRYYPELNHGHSSGFSDGSDTLLKLVEETARMGITRRAVTDHYDITGISEYSSESPQPGYLGESNFSDLRDMIEAIDVISNDLPHDQRADTDSFDVCLIPGMEINYDPREGKDKEILDHVRELDESIESDYDIHGLLSVHHDEEGNNFKNLSPFLGNESLDRTVEKYFEHSEDAVDLIDEMPNTNVLAHPNRIERSPIFWRLDEPEVRNELIQGNSTIDSESDLQEQLDDAYDALKEGYESLYDKIKSINRGRSFDEKIFPEYNAKVSLRHQTMAGSPTLGSEILRGHGVEFTGGTDSHRIGKSSNPEKVDYKLNESEERMTMLDYEAEQNENMVTVLDKLNGRQIRLGIEEGFKRGNNRENIYAEPI